jgi:hypothetical protein
MKSGHKIKSSRLPGINAGLAARSAAKKILYIVQIVKSIPFLQPTLC